MPNRQALRGLASRRANGATALGPLRLRVGHVFFWVMSYASYIPTSPNIYKSIKSKNLKIYHNKYTAPLHNTKAVSQSHGLALPGIVRISASIAGDRITTDICVTIASGRIVGTAGVCLARRRCVKSNDATALLAVEGTGQQKWTPPAATDRRTSFRPNDVRETQWRNCSTEGGGTGLAEELAPDC